MVNLVPPGNPDLLGMLRDHDLHAAILLAACRGAVRSDRIGLTITACKNPLATDAIAEQKALDGLGTALREVYIIGLRALAVGMPLDHYRLIRVFVEERDQAI
jgi:hypothetical protein